MRLADARVGPGDEEAARPADASSRERPQRRASTSGRDLGGLVRGREGDPQPGRARRDGRRSDRRDEDAALRAAPPTAASARASLPRTNGQDRAAGSGVGQGSRPLGEQRSPSCGAAVRMGAEQRPAPVALGAGDEARGRRAAAAATGGGSAVVKMKVRARLTSRSRSAPAAGREAARGAERLAEGSDEDVGDDAGGRAEAAPAGPEDAEGVGLVDDEDGVGVWAASARAASGAASPSMLNSDSVTRRRRRNGPGSASRRRGSAGVAVGVDGDPGAREAAAVDEAGVVEGVGDDEVVGSGEGGRGRRGWSGSRSGRRGRPGGRGSAASAASSCAVRGQVAGDQAGGGGAEAVAGGGRRGRGGQGRVGGQAEVVVRTEREPRLPRDCHCSFSRVPDDFGTGAAAIDGGQLRQLGLQDRLERAHVFLYQLRGAGVPRETNTRNAVQPTDGRPMFHVEHQAGVSIGTSISARLPPP